MTLISSTTALGFESLDQGLDEIPRYNMYPVMFYRNTVYAHAQRVTNLLGLAAPFLTAMYGQQIDLVKAGIMAERHDDSELVTGDIQAGDKSVMSDAELAEVKQREWEAIELLALRYPQTISGYSYLQLLQEVWSKSSLEARIVSLLDKWDGFGEALHELYAGNRTFSVPTPRPSGIIPSPPEFYPPVIAKLFVDYPELQNPLVG